MNANGSRLSALTRELLQQWKDTRDSWRDTKALDFEQRYLAELVPSLERTVGAIEQVDKLITKIKKDCE